MRTDIKLLFPPLLQAAVALGFAVQAVLSVAMVSLPVWWLLSRAGRPGWRAAAILGFGLTLTYWIVENVHSQSPTDLLAEGALWGLVGSAAGLLTWRVAYRRRAQSDLDLLFE